VNATDKTGIYCFIGNTQNHGDLKSYKLVIAAVPGPSRPVTCAATTIRKFFASAQENNHMKLRIALLATTCALFAASTLHADTTTPDYHPSMGDLMTMAVQPRHSKLGLAGQNKNWVYATYELSELRNAFARIGRTIPTYQNTDVPALFATMTQTPLAEVEDAIKAGDPGRFKRAYATLTATCNACHQSQSHAMVVIKTPSASMYPDQEFKPAK
jgi:hypothetical protein